MYWRRGWVGEKTIHANVYGLVFSNFFIPALDHFLLFSPLCHTLDFKLFINIDIFDVCLKRLYEKNYCVYFSSEHRKKNTENCTEKKKLFCCNFLSWRGIIPKIFPKIVPLIVLIWAQRHGVKEEKERRRKKNTLGSVSIRPTNSTNR